MTDRPEVWYDCEEDLIRGRKVDVDQTKILITCDPLDGMTEETARSIDAWFNVSDSPCNTLKQPPWKTLMYWYPIRECGYWDYDPFYYFKKIMDDLVFNKKLKKILVHCHAGACRSPTMVYFWLCSHYGWRESAKMLYPGERKEEKNYRYWYVDPVTGKNVHGFGGMNAGSEETEWEETVEKEGKEYTVKVYRNGPVYEHKTYWREQVQWHIRMIKRGNIPRHLSKFYSLMEEHPTYGLEGLYFKMRDVDRLENLSSELISQLLRADEDIRNPILNKINNSYPWRNND